MSDNIAYITLEAAERNLAKSKLAGLGIISAADLGNKVFPPIRYVIPGILPEGASILAGRPKLGKSWLALDMALTVARGTHCLGDIKCEQGDVLYLALEDNERRLQSRIRKVSPPHAEEPWPEHLSLVTTWQRCEEGGLESLRDWITSVARPRLIIVDVLAQFRSGRGNTESMYESDYGAVKSLQELAGEYGLAILIIHHVRKGSGDVDPFERVSGTMGLTGAADTTLILDRDGNGCSLYGRGRDIMEFEKAVTFNKESCRWTIQGEASEVRVTDERGQILAVLQDAGEALAPSEIAALADMKSGNVRRLVVKMTAAGQIVKEGAGKYRHPGVASCTGNDD